jgi:hypothetical protein
MIRVDEGLDILRDLLKLDDFASSSSFAADPPIDLSALRVGHISSS